MTSATVSPLDVMKGSRVIAVVGASTNPQKDAHVIPAFLKEKGYRIVPINPSAGEIFGERAFPSLGSLPDEVAREVDIVEVFRPSAELPQVARQVIDLSKRQGREYVFWSQSGLENEEAKMMLGANGIPFVMDACMRVVYGIVNGKKG